MLCEKCQTREARVKITKVVNGVAEVHNLCTECASPFRLNPEDPNEAEWSRAIFKMLTEAVMKQMSSGKDNTEDDKLKSIACPTCGKTYGEYQEDGLLGCGDCYEAFSAQVNAHAMTIQGADTHNGKKIGKAKRRTTRKPVTPETTRLTKEEEISILNMKLEEAVSIEDYENAARLRDEIRRLEGENHG